MSEICILYCLTKRELTIYSVKKHIELIFGAYTKPSHGTIYPALKKLLNDGYVSVRESLSEGGKKSSYYSVTEKGKKLFQKLMLEDFSDNPSVFLNEIYLRLSAIGILNGENKKFLLEKCLKMLDLYSVKIQRTLNNEYNGFDDYQKSVTAQKLKQILLLSDYLKSFKV